MSEEKKVSLSLFIATATLVLTILFHVLIFTFGYGRLDARVTNLETQMQKQEQCLEKAVDALNSLKTDVAVIREKIEGQMKK